MQRIIFVPQFPTLMRYQEWWFHTFPSEFKKRGFEVLTLGEEYAKSIRHRDSQREMFSPINQAIELETQQVNEYMNLELRDDDILFLADLSFPGIFSNVLYHKRGSKMYAFCHATSLNIGDYFKRVVGSKILTEIGNSELFDKIFVGSEYHKSKLMNESTSFHLFDYWKNTVVTYLPFPPLTPSPIINKRYDIISVSRPTPQKVNLEIESKIINIFGQINRPISTTWNDYFDNLAMSKILLITAKEETFGYQVVDAIMNGCIPLASNKCSYPELLPQEYLYNDVYELMGKIDNILYNNIDAPIPVPKLKCEEQMNKFYDVICDEMKEE